MGSPAPELGNEPKTEETETSTDATTTTESPATADGQDSAAE